MGTPACSTPKEKAKYKMKSPIITAACVAAIALGAPGSAGAQDKKSPLSNPVPSAAARDAATEKPSRPIPYRGKVVSANQTAKTFVVGKWTMKVTADTAITKQGAVATMADIVVDEQVRGSYWKKEDGTLEAKSVKLGAKASGEKPVNGARKNEGATSDVEKEEKKAKNAAAPSTSP